MTDKSWVQIITNHYPLYEMHIKKKGYLCCEPSLASLIEWYTWIEEQAKEREQKPPAPIVAPEISDAPD